MDGSGKACDADVDRRPRYKGKVQKAADVGVNHIQSHLMQGWTMWERGEAGSRKQEAGSRQQATKQRAMEGLMRTDDSTWESSGRGHVLAPGQISTNEARNKMQKSNVQATKYR